MSRPTINPMCRGCVREFDNCRKCIYIDESKGTVNSESHRSLPVILEMPPAPIKSPRDIELEERMRLYREEDARKENESDWFDDRLSKLVVSWS